MTKRKPQSKNYEAMITAARKAGGNNIQSHWRARLMAVLKMRARQWKDMTKR